MYHDYIQTYLDETKQIADSIDRNAIHQTIEILKDVRDKNGRLFILGIGGSAANASHAVNDFRKICRIETYTPVDNVAELTAWTNDNHFDVIFKHWLEGSQLREEDAVMVLSVGGGSESASLNIVRALEYAKLVGARTLGIVSRDGGMTKKIADSAILVPVVHDDRITPHAEGWQGVVWHLIVNALDAHHNTAPYGWHPTKHRAVFIDRDGVVNEPIPRPRSKYKDPTAPWRFKELSVYDHVEKALALLKKKGFLTILVTNQPDVRHGNMKEGEFIKIKREIEKLPFDDIYICEHASSDGCVCRKPRPGMLLNAHSKWGIDLKNSFMIGDNETDIMAGHDAGCNGILIDTHYNQEVAHDVRAKNLLEAAKMIIKS
jgi:D-sedoheptulose 7-phosphate isomerase